MLRVWGKLWAKGRIKESITAQDAHTDWDMETRLSECEDEIIRKLDLPRPIWLDKNRQEIRNFGSTRFDQDSFIEHFPYQALELEIIGTDEDDEENRQES